MAHVDTVPRTTTGAARIPVAGWLVYYRAFFMHTSATLFRRRRTILAGVFAMLPVLIPLLLTFSTSAAVPVGGNTLLVSLIERFYLAAISPLLGLFFGCMLVGEDIESQAIQSVLARPAARSAIVLGRFSAYLVVANGIMLPPMVLVYVACTTLGGISISQDGLLLIAHYAGVSFMSLMGYGALCMFIGAALRWPMVVGIGVIFVWQRLALLVPGLIDFVTIEKYVRSMLPLLATEREKPTARFGMMELNKQELLLDPLMSAGSLAIITAVFLLATTFILRRREYTGAKAIGG
jgi:ABC-type transport system involved in multi-copper enzyme maturation permease subunit